MTGDSQPLNLVIPTATIFITTAVTSDSPSCFFRFRSNTIRKFRTLRKLPTYGSTKDSATLFRGPNATLLKLLSRDESIQLINPKHKRGNWLGQTFTIDMPR